MLVFRAPAKAAQALVVCAAVLVSASNLLAATIGGTVRDAATGTQLGGMTVQAYSLSGQSAASKTTDSAGHYTMTLPAGQYRLLAFDPGARYATAFDGDAESFDVTSPVSLDTASNATVDLNMKIGGTLTGTVTSDTTGLAGITVAAYNVPSGTRRNFTATSAGGVFSLLLPPGTYKLAAYEERPPDTRRYGVLFSGDSVTFDGAAPLDVVAETVVSGINFHLQIAGTLTGTVRDAESGDPFTNVKVYAYTTAGLLMARTVTATDGRFFFSLPPGKAKVVAVDPAGLFASGFPDGARSFAKSAPIVVRSGESATADVTLERAGRIGGRVTAAAGGAPLAGIHVAAYNEDDGTLCAETTTDWDGYYSVALPAGRFRTAAYDAALTYATLFFPSRLDFGTATSLAVTAGRVTAPVDFTLIRAGRFTGVVTDAETASPLANVVVAAYDEGGVNVGNGRTTATGKYAMALPPGTYRLLAYDSSCVHANAFDAGAANYETTPPRTAIADMTVTADFSMRRAVKITGTILNGFAPIEGIEVSALDLSGNHVATAVTADDGRFELPVLPGGSYKLWAVDPARRYSAGFYDGASRLETATVIAVNTDPPSAVTWTLSWAQRRRSVGR